MPRSLAVSPLLPVTLLALLGCACALQPREGEPERDHSARAARGQLAVRMVPLGAPEFPPAGRREAQADRPAPAGLPAAVSTSGVAAAAAKARLADAITVVGQTRVLIPGWTGADAALARSRAAESQTDWGHTSAYASQAFAEAEAALSDFYALRAAEQLQRSYQFTGLDDDQLLQRRAAEETLVAGNSRRAYGRLRTLNDGLSRRTKSYTVAFGDSLWVISGKPEAYANPWLWPLIWRANLDVIRNPNRLLRGQVLKLRPHPTLDEVVEAVSEARGRAVTLEIGEIRVADPP